MTTRANIEAAVYTWIQTATGVTTIFADQAYPRPAGTYAAIKLGTIVSIGHDEERYLTDPGAPEYATLTLRGDREISVSVQVHGTGAMDLARAAARALAKGSTRVQLATAGLCPRTLVPAVNELTSLLETDFEERAQFDATLAFAEDFAEADVPLIEEAEYNGIYLAVDTASVLYPEATLIGVGGLTASLQYLLSAGATLQGYGSASSTAYRTRLRAATLAGAGGSVVAEGELTRLRLVSATLAGAGAVSTGAHLRTRGRSATLAGAGAVTADHQRYRPAAATLAGAGAVTATAVLGDALFAALTGHEGAYDPDRYAAATAAGAGGIDATAQRWRGSAVTASMAGLGGVTAGALPRYRQRTATTAGSGAASAGDYTRTRKRTATVAGVGAVTASATKSDALLVTL